MNGPSLEKEPQMSEEEKAPAAREYPRFYERVVPVALGVIAAAILFLLLVILAVALGLFPVR